MQCMRTIKCAIVSLTTATCFAIVLICSFLENENSTMPALYPATYYDKQMQNDQAFGNQDEGYSSNNAMDTSQSQGLKPNRQFTRSDAVKPGVDDPVKPKFSAVPTHNRGRGKQSESLLPEANQKPQSKESSTLLPTANQNNKSKESSPFSQTENQTHKSKESITTAEGYQQVNGVDEGYIASRVPDRTTMVPYKPVADKVPNIIVPVSNSSIESDVNRNPQNNIYTDPNIAIKTSEGRRTKENKNKALLSTEMKELIKERYKSRNDFMKEKCQKTRGSLNTGKTPMPKLAYYIRNYKLLICIPAKSGATTWKTHMIRMMGYSKSLNPHSEWAHNHLRARMILDDKRANEAKSSKSTVRIISVRHPIPRLISAYNNKFSYGTLHVPNSVTTKYVGLVREIQGRKLKKGVPTQVTFSEFLKLVLHEKKKGLHKMNNHWRPQYSTCTPCAIHYDYVLKQETFDEDLRYLVQELDIKEIEVDLKANPSKKTNVKSYGDYFAKVPNYILKQIYELYKLDFVLFNYTVPQELKDRLGAFR